jgi:hypothetical protein
MSYVREAFEKIERHFTSGNSVEVERATILRTDWELAKQYIILSGVVPGVCDGKEQLAFEVYATRKGYDMAEHPLHYLFTNKTTNTARRAWAAAISYCDNCLKQESTQ